MSLCIACHPECGGLHTKRPFVAKGFGSKNCVCVSKNSFSGLNETVVT